MAAANQLIMNENRSEVCEVIIFSVKTCNMDSLDVDFILDPIARDFHNDIEEINNFEGNVENLLCFFYSSVIYLFFILKVRQDL